MLTLLIKLFGLHPALLPIYFVFTTTANTLPATILSVSNPARLQTIDRTGNAVWLQHSWLQEGVTDEQYSALCGVLQTQKIRFVYPHLSPSNTDGRLPLFSMDSARKFRKIFQQQCPEIRILPWIGGVKAGFRQMRPGTVNLDSASYLNTFANECLFLTSGLGFDGVHINIEPVESGNTRFLEWLDQIRSTMPAGKLLSVAANKPSFIDGFNVSKLRSWDLDYFKAVGNKSDQLAIMNYDTGLSNGFLYSFYTQEKLSAMLRQFAENRIACRILLGVPTYDDSPNHKQHAENIRTAVDGLKAALGRDDLDHRNFQGIALYGYWTTDPNEWQQYSEYWLNPIP